MAKLLKSAASVAAILMTFLLAQGVHAQTEDFVDQASAKGIAEIESARIALKESQSQEVKSFAQKMISDHTNSRQELSQLAQKHNLEISDEATLMDKAKAWILQWRDGENFDRAYANNQVKAHEQTIAFYREYGEQGQDENLKQYAKKTLPTLEQHLQEAKQLAQKVGAEEAGQDSQRSREQQREEAEEAEEESQR